MPYKLPIVEQATPPVDLDATWYHTGEGEIFTYDASRTAWITPYSRVINFAYKGNIPQGRATASGTYQNGEFKYGPLGLLGRYYVDYGRILIDYAVFSYTSKVDYRFDLPFTFYANDVQVASLTNTLPADQYHFNVYDMYTWRQDIDTYSYDLINDYECPGIYALIGPVPNLDAIQLIVRGSYYYRRVYTP